MSLHNLYIDEQINTVKNTPKIKLMLQTSTEMSTTSRFLKNWLWSDFSKYCYDS